MGGKGSKDQPAKAPAKQEGPSQAADSVKAPQAAVAAAASPKAKSNQDIQPNPEVGAYLKEVPLLAKLTDDERSQLGGHLIRMEFQDGNKIIEQGTPGDGFFIIKQGEALVTRVDPETKEESTIARLKAGDYFGETALLNNASRGATVTAVGSLTAFYLEREKFHKLFGKDFLNVQFAKRNAISAEQISQFRANLAAVSENDKKKSSDQSKTILQAVMNNVLFSQLNYEHQLRIVEEMWCVDVKKGTPVINQGEPGDNFYVIESGRFDVFMKRENKEKKEATATRVGTKSAGNSFGELALMYNAPRSATVTATEDSIVWALDRFTFRKIVTNMSEQKLKEHEAFLKQVELLAPLTEYERSKIAEALEEVSFPPNTAIMKQGDEGNSFYILASGEVVVTRIDGNEPAKEVARLKEGQYFGEKALLENDVRAATVTSVGHVKCLSLNRAAFSLLLGPLEDILKSGLSRYKSERKEEQVRKFPLVDTKKEDLEVLGTLGRGSFGHVQLVRDKKSGEVYALKAVRKAQIVKTGQQGHVMNEKRAMALFDHPFLIKLFATYKDRNNLYFLLEPSLGGELFTILRKRTLFDEPTARFYAASVVLGFEYMHNRDMVYRDLKPENLLLDAHGTLKITDFGFAKQVRDRTYTLCGTPDYLAPEIVSGQGHGKGVDWWTLGILIFEMLASYPPFYDEDTMQIYAKIMAGNVKYPKHFSKNAIDLIRNLLAPKPTKRLGVVQGGATTIKNHPWFAGFDWDALVNLKLKPPIVPKLKGKADMSNFEEYPDDSDPSFNKYDDDGSNWDADF